MHNRDKAILFFLYVNRTRNQNKSLKTSTFFSGDVDVNSTKTIRPTLTLNKIQLIRSFQLESEGEDDKKSGPQSGARIVASRLFVSGRAIPPISSSSRTALLYSSLQFMSLNCHTSSHYIRRSNGIDWQET